MRKGMVDRHPILIAMIAGIALQGAALAQSTMSAARAHYGCLVSRRTNLLAPTQF